MCVHCAVWGHMLAFGFLAWHGSQHAHIASVLNRTTAACTALTAGVALLLAPTILMRADTW